MISLVDNAIGLALLNRFKDNVPGLALANKDVIFSPEELAQRVHAERVKENKLEFINYWRNAPNFDWTRQRTPPGRGGLFTNQDGPWTKGKKSVPVTFNFECCYWTIERRNSNAFEEEYAFWVHEDPTINFKSDGIEIPHKFYMKFEPATEEVKDWFNDGRYIKVKFGIQVEGWIIKDIREHTIETIEFDVFLESRDGNVLLSHTEITAPVVVPDP